MRLRAPASCSSRPMQSRGNPFSLAFSPPSQHGFGTRSLCTSKFPMKCDILSVMDAIGNAFIVKLGAERMQLICGMMKCAHAAHTSAGGHIVRLIECERPKVARLHTHSVPLFPFPFVFELITLHLRRITWIRRNFGCWNANRSRLTVALLTI